MATTPSVPDCRSPFSQETQIHRGRYLYSAFQPTDFLSAFTAAPRNQLARFFQQPNDGRILANIRGPDLRSQLGQLRLAVEGRKRISRPLPCCPLSKHQARHSCSRRAERIFTVQFVKHVQKHSEIFDSFGRSISCLSTAPFFLSSLVSLVPARKGTAPSMAN